MLCRACGNNMIAFEYCSDCNEAIHWRCVTCKKENDRSVHTHRIQESSKLTSTFGTIVALASGLSIIMST